jgi:hypothetical protein
VATTRILRSENFPDLADEVLHPRLSDAKLSYVRAGASNRVAGAVGDGALVVRFAYDVLAA